MPFAPPPRQQRLLLPTRRRADRRESRFSPVRTDPGAPELRDVERVRPHPTHVWLLQVAIGIEEQGQNRHLSQQVFFAPGELYHALDRITLRVGSIDHSIELGIAPA